MLGEARPRQHCEGRLRKALGHHLAQQLAGRLLEPLCTNDQRLAVRQMASELRAHRSRMLGRCHHQHHILGGDISQLIRGFEPCIQRYAWQKQRIAVPGIDVGDDLGLARPQKGVAACQAHGLRQRCTPRPTPDNADASEGHLERAPCLTRRCATLDRRRRRPSSLCALPAGAKCRRRVGVQGPARPRFEIEPVGHSACQALGARHHHRRVIGA